MKKAVNVNRLFLGLVLISLSAPFLFSRFWQELGVYQNLAMTQLIFLIPVLIYIGCTRGEVLNDLQLHIPKVSTVLMTFVLASLLTPVMAWLNLFSMLFTENYVAGTMMELYDSSLTRNLAYVALLPALSEEFIFRGVFYHSYRPAGVWKAALLSGFCFGLLHMNLNQFFYGFVLGVVFALLVEASGSLLSSMFLHFLLNANSVYMMELLKELEELMGVSQLPQAVETMTSRKEILTALGAYTLSAVIGGILAFLALRFIARRNGKGNLFTRKCLAGGSPETERPGDYAGDRSPESSRGFYENGWRRDGGRERDGSYESGWRDGGGGSAGSYENGWRRDGGGERDGSYESGWRRDGGQEWYASGENTRQQRTEEGYGDHEEKKKRKKRAGGERIFTPSLAAAAVIAVLYMLILNFV